ncbi:MAG: hypothetical protein ACYTBS_08540, partial [Planctomycetota bacterium]
MRSSENVEKLIRNAEMHSDPEVNQAVLKDLMHQLDETQAQKPAVVQPVIGRILMKSPITKLAAAAVIVVAVLIAINQLGGSSTSVVWGEVVQNVEASPGFIFQMKQIYHRETTGTMEIHNKVYGSGEYGVRMDGHLEPESPIQVYASRKEGAMILIDHSSKTYSRKPLTGDELVELEKMDPKECVSKMLSVGYIKLGRKTIDGIEAEGVEITNPAGASISSETPIKIDSHVAQLWVAVETGLPVFLESKTSINNGMQRSHTVQNNFQWNVELDASEFEPDIPEDYTLMEVEIDADGRTSFKTTEEYDSQEAAEAKIRKWRFRDKHPERGYRLLSEDGQAATSIPESWADSPEHAVRVQEELDLQKRQDNRELVEVREIEANGQLDFRILRYEYKLSDGQTVRVPDFEPDDPSQWTVIGKRQEELSQLLRERR